MTKWRLWQAAASDEEALCLLEREAFGSRSWGGESLKGSVNAAGVEVILGGSPSGVAQGFIVWRDLGVEAEILTLGVVEAARRCGLASALLEETVKATRKTGATRLFLEVDAGNAAAVGLYCKYGFADVGLRKGYYRDGADARVMALELGPSSSL